MTTDEAWSLVRQARALLDPVRECFPCEWCGGAAGSGDYNYEPCLHCGGKGYQIQDRETTDADD